MPSSPSSDLNQTMPDSANPPGLGELSRQVREVLARYEAIANKLEANFVNKEIFKLYTDGVTRELEHLSDAAKSQIAALAEADKAQKVAEKERNDRLEQRISKLEGNFTWVVRIVVAAVIVAVLAGVGISKAGGGG